MSSAVRLRCSPTVNPTGTADEPYSARASVVPHAINYDVIAVHSGRRGDVVRGHVYQCITFAAGMGVNLILTPNRLGWGSGPEGAGNRHRATERLLMQSH